MCRESVDSCLYLVDLSLSQIDVVVQLSDFLVAFLHQRLSVGHLLPDEGKIRKHGAALGCILSQLLVDDRDLTLEARLPFLLSSSVLRTGTDRHAQQYQYIYKLLPHFFISSLLLSIFSSRSGISSTFFCLARFQYTKAMSYSLRANRTSA